MTPRQPRLGHRRRFDRTSSRMPERDCGSPKAWRFAHWMRATSRMGTESLLAENCLCWVVHFPPQAVLTQQPDSKTISLLVCFVSKFTEVRTLMCKSEDRQPCLGEPLPHQRPMWQSVQMQASSVFHVSSGARAGYSVAARIFQ